MPETPKAARLPRSKGIAIQAAHNPSDTGLFFDTDQGLIGVVLDKQHLSLVVSVIVEHASGLTEHKTGQHDLTVNFDPLLTQAMAVEKGPTPDTAYVSMYIGKGVNLTFVVQKSVLKSQCERAAAEIL